MGERGVLKSGGRPHLDKLNSSLKLLVVPSDERHAKRMSRCDVDCIHSSKGESRCDSPGLPAERTTNINERHRRQIGHTLHGFDSQTRNSCDASNDTRDLGQRDCRREQIGPRLKETLNPGDSVAMVDVTHHQPAYPHTGIENRQKRSLCSRTASTALSPSGQRAPIRRARSSVSFIHAAISSGGMRRVAGTILATSRPRTVIAIGCFVSFTSRTISLAFDLSSLIPTDLTGTTLRSHIVTHGDHLL